VVNRTAAVREEPAAPVVDGGDLTRLTLRMPEALKTHVEQMAAAEGISVNSWLVRAVTAAVQRPAGPPPSPGGKRITGFAQA
jgi:predicted HicB family RNase H-like nuclease